jgi:hypothetical protein
MTIGIDTSGSGAVTRRRLDVRPRRIYIRIRRIDDHRHSNPILYAKTTITTTTNRCVVRAVLEARVAALGIPVVRTALEQVKLLAIAHTEYMLK